MKARLIFAVVCALGTTISTAAPALAVEPVVVVATERPELGPTASTTYLAWFAFGEHFHSNVYAQAIGSDAPFRVNPEHTSAFTGGIEGSTLIYEVRPRDENSELAMVDLSTQMGLEIPEGINTDADEGSPSISGVHILFRRVEGKRTAINLFDTTTGTSLVLYEKGNTRRRFFDILPIQVNGNYVVWQQIAFSKKDGHIISGDVFLYDITAATTTKIPGTDTWEYGVSVDAAGTTYFGRSDFSCGQGAEMIARQLDGTEAVIYTFPHGRDFSFSWAVENTEGSTDLYFDQGSCRGDDFGDILVLQRV